MSSAIRHGERFGPRGPECRGSFQRVHLRPVELIHREYECASCGQVLRVRPSERTGEATLPRHRAERKAPTMSVGALVHAPACEACSSDLWTLSVGVLFCYGQDCTATRKI